MSDDFSFSEYFKTCFKYWYVFALTILLGVAGFLSAVSFRTFYSYCVYDGVLRVASIDSFISTGFEGAELIKFYDTICERAVKVMMDEEVKFEVFNEFNERLFPDKKDDKNKRDFFDSLKIMGKKDTVNVSFSFPMTTKEDKKLVESVVVSYMHRASLRATADSPLLAGRLTNTAYENLDTKKLNTQNLGSNVQGVFISAVIAIALSFVVVSIIFFTDRRLKSAERLNVNNAVFSDLYSKESLTKLDAFCEGKEHSKVLGFVGLNLSVSELVCAFAKEISVSGRKVLVVGIGEGRIKEEAESVAGFDYMGFGSLMEAISGKESFCGGGYDRVLVYTGGESGTKEVLNRICERFIVVINQAKTMKKEIAEVLTEFSDERVGAILITNTSPVFFTK